MNCFVNTPSNKSLDVGLDLPDIASKNRERASGLRALVGEGGAEVVGREFLSVFTVVVNYPERRIAFLR